MPAPSAKKAAAKKPPAPKAPAYVPNSSMPSYGVPANNQARAVEIARGPGAVRDTETGAVTRPLTRTTNVTGGGPAAPAITAPPSVAVPTTAPPVTAPPPTVAPPAGPGGPDPAAQAQANQLREQELETALRALEAKYSLTREQLMGDQTEVGDQYRFILTALQRSRQQALEGVEGDFLSRGLLRSGLYLGEQAGVNQQFASQQADAEAQKAARLRAIQQALASTDAEYAQGQTATSAEVIRAQMDAIARQAQSYSLA